MSTPPQIQIKRIVTTDGHLRDIPLTLSPELNCIIGARGTCKSTIVETIRFAFDDDPGRVAELLESDTNVDGPGHSGLIRATLRGGTARLELGSIDSAGEREAIVERDASSKPRVYVDGVKAVDDESLLSEIEIYSQGELQEIAVSPAKRLALVDRPHKADIDDWLRQSSRLAGDIAELGPPIRELREAIASSERTLRDGEEMRAELARAQEARPAMSPEMTLARAAFQERERLQVRAAEAAEGYVTEVKEIEAAVGRLRAAVAPVTELQTIGSPALRSISDLLAASAAAGVELMDALAAPDAVAERLDLARREFEKESETYTKLLREEQAVTEAIRREDRLSEEVQKLDRVAMGLEERKRRLEALERERAEKRQALRDLRTKIFRLRLEEVDRINSHFSDHIVLTLNHGTHSQRYRQKLVDLLAGSRLREREALCAQIASVLPPDRLVSLIDDDDAHALADVLNRDSGQMMRLISHLSESGDLYHLEAEIAEDDLDITMFVDDVPRSVNEMSKGQKATAILPLVLRSAPYPLILDQPEDDLDNHFIFETLVQKIADLKKERQLIFVTHNANIPVIGDAETVFVMTMDGPDHAALRGHGNVTEMRDEIIDLLEGGREAFELRSHTYGYDDRE